MSNDPNVNIQDKYAPLKRSVCRPQRLTSSPDGTFVLFLRDTESSSSLSLWKVNSPTQGPSTTEAMATLLVSEMGTSLKEGEFSKEEQMVRERLRQTTLGVTSFTFHPNYSHKVLIPCNSSLYIFDINSNTLRDVLDSPCLPSGAKMDCKFIKGGGDIVVFTVGENLYVADTAWDAPTIRFTGNGTAAAGIQSQEFPTKALSTMPLTTKGKGDIKCGVPDYITQEEFNRMTAFWPRPYKTGQRFAVLYTVTDETKLGRAAVIDPNGAVEQFPFPRPGTTNATTQLEIVFFDGVGAGQGTETLALSMQDVEKFFGFGVEYYPRMGWTPQGNIWVMGLDRAQENMRIIVLELEAFGKPAGTDLSPFVRVLVTEGFPHAWYNVTSNYQFLNGADDSFLYTSQLNSTQHMHLFCVGESREKTREVTCGEWSVFDSSINVVAKDTAAYFLCNKDSMVGKSLYRVDLMTGAMERVSAEGDFVHAYSVVDDDKRICAVLISRLDIPFNLTFTHTAVASVSPRWQLPSNTPACRTPDILYATNQNGKRLPIALYRPQNPTLQEGTSALIVHIYGGPHVQTVLAEYGTTINHRLQLFLSLGYFVAMVDNQAIFNQGLGYESVAKHRMGQFEVADVECCARHVCSVEPRINPNRIGTFGWSYGGYVSLLCAAQAANFFKVCISGAPVGLWEHYDTAYTERYMGTPATNPEGYRKAQVATYAEGFPSEANRVVLLHGLSDENVHFTHTAAVIEAMVKKEKPYTLQVYPGERHGVRGGAAGKHLNAFVLHTFQLHL